MRKHLIPVRMAKTNTKTIGVGEDVEKKKIHAPLVEMQTGAATLENSMEVPQKGKNRTILPSSSCTTRCSTYIHLGKEYKNTKVLTQRDTCSLMFTAALVTTTWTQKQCKYPSMDKWING